METAIVVVWSIGLFGALVATLVILKEVALVLGALAAIDRLARIIRDASRGLAANTAAVSAVAPRGDSAGRLRGAVTRAAGAASTVARKLEA